MKFILGVVRKRRGTREGGIQYQTHQYTTTPGEDATTHYLCRTFAKIQCTPSQSIDVTLEAKFWFDGGEGLGLLGEGCNDICADA